MCTVTWRHEAGAVDVLFNRDEKRARPIAIPPAVHEWDGERVVAAIDGAAGGTWLAANEHGLVVGLLNYYEKSTVAPPPNACSRGLLVRAAASLRGIGEVEGLLREKDLSRYPPFLLLWMTRTDAARLAAWDARILEFRDVADRMVTTSSFDTHAVLASRAERFRALSVSRHSVPALEAFHQSTSPRGGAYSVCMTRDDAMTVSFSHVRVDTSAVVFRYRARHADGSWGEETETRMPLA